MISLLALRELSSAQRAEQVISDPASRLFGREPSISTTDRLQVALEVLEDRPDDARVQLFAAERYIDRYRVLAADQLRQGRFTSTVNPNQSNHLTGTDVEINPFERRFAPARICEVQVAAD